MKKNVCRKCGAKLPKNTQFCTSCGEKTEKKKLKHKGAIITGSIVLLAVVIGIFVVVAVPFLKQYNSYQQAVNLLQEKQYDEAKQAFWVLGDFKDSKNQMQQCDYQKAEDAHENKKYEDAIELYEELGEYKDAKKKALLCQYEMAEEKFTKKDYSEAAKIYEKLGEYEDAKDKVKECKYQEGMEVFLDYDYESAEEVLKEIKDYKNVKKCLTEIEWKKAYLKVLSDWTIVKKMEDISSYGQVRYEDSYLGEFDYDEYFLKDLDGDGIPELILYSQPESSYDPGLTAILTYKTSLQYVGCFLDAAFNENNQIIEWWHIHGAGTMWDYEFYVYEYEPKNIKKMNGNGFMDEFYVTDEVCYYVSYDCAGQSSHNKHNEPLEMTKNMKVIEKDKYGFGFRTSKKDFLKIYHKVYDNATWMKDVEKTELSDYSALYEAGDVNLQ